MGSSDNGSQVVRILDAVEHHQQAGSGSREHVVEFGIALRGSEGHDALVRGPVRSAIERLAWLEAHRHGTVPGQIDDLLQTRATGSPSDQQAVERASGAQGLAHWMDTGQKAARLA